MAQSSPILLLSLKMHEYLISPKVYAIGCAINGSQLIAEMLYLKEEFALETKVDLYSDDRVLVATVLIPKTDINTHQNITLPICL
jgi:hypothetical protein